MKEKFKDSALSPKERAEDLLPRLTLREKVGQVNQKLYGFQSFTCNGEHVELADSFELIAHSVHPYTRSLISAIPEADPKTARAAKRIPLEGDVPSPLNPPSGCRFRTRCPYADEQCANECPQLKEVSPGHFAACHHLDKVAD